MNKVIPIDEEYLFEGSVMISQTDLEGNIVYVNNKYSEVSGYSKNELLSGTHNLVRHPTMPKAVYEKMWDTLKSGHTWNGLLKNLRKDGMYYWIDTEILPISDEENNLTGYIASSKTASPKGIEENEAIYNKMLEEQK